ncbi:MAG: DUF1579 domain-containing protein [Acidobacteria bacterium]|nr:MAG: DUF1579 domain-containing protein [Acidobacteriota bacterium]
METSKTEQEMCMKVEPQAEHQWLQKLAGTWTSECEAMMEPGKPSEKVTWTETVRSLGGIWIIAEGQGETPGGNATTMMTLGYDPQKKRFVGTFVASMMTNMFVYEGALDSTGKVLRLDTEGPSMTGDGKIAKYQDIMEIKSDDHRVLTSQILTDDGNWVKFMEANYRRTK